MAKREIDGRALFKGKDTSFGIFYPTDYVIAAFDSFETAKKAAETMLEAGYSTDEVDAVPSQYVIENIERGIEDASWLDQVKQEISKALGSEAHYWENDLRMARAGAGFLTVFCPTEHEGHRVRRLLAPHAPQSMRRYAKLAIERL